MPSPVRAALLVLASGDLDRTLSGEGLDWDAVREGVCRNGLVGLTQRYLQHGASRALPPAAFRAAIATTDAVVRAHLAVTYRWLHDIATVLDDAEVPFLVLKGPAIAQVAYPAPLLRSFGDLDLMVRERDLSRAHAALVGAGLIADESTAAIPAKLTTACTVYERTYRDATTGFVLDLHGDDLLNAGLASRDLDGYWRRARDLDVFGRRMASLAPEDHLIHLCCHAHFHGYVRLSWIADLALLLRDAGVDIDWDQVVSTVGREEAAMPVWFSLVCLERLVGVSTPPDVLRAIQPDAVRRRLHEHYLPLDRVLSLGPMPRPSFSFYFLPVFKRLLPDLLVMGRRRDKLRYLARLAVPPPAWLREYYHLPDGRSVVPHAILHPLKLAGHLARETWLAGFRNRPWWNTST